MNAWMWLAMGIALAGIELFADTSFYLLFAAAAALLIAAALSTGIPLIEPAQWTVFGVLAIVLLVFYRKKLHQRVMEKATTESAEANVDRHVTLKAALGPGETTRIDIRGSQWWIKNITNRRIGAGAQAVVLGRENLTLQVGPED